MTTYDSAPLVQAAEAQLRAADGWVWIGSAFGALVGLGVGTSGMNPAGALGVVWSVLLGTLVGFLAGTARARQLRLRAHLMLWRVQLEENTRNAAYYQHQLLQRVAARKP